MNEGWFSKPVPVSEGFTGDIRYVSSARQAVEMLTGNWHGQGSAKHLAALRACQGVTHGHISPEQAREAFVEAAEEARILAE
jgi:hypothetical protein